MEDREFFEAELLRVRDQRDQLRQENERLRRENERLQARLGPSDADGVIAVQLHLPDPPSANPVTSVSSATEKIGLFKRLFRGRQDVYAVRWERSDGRVGYAPASRTRLDRERGVFLPLSDKVLHNHLNGRRTVGIYPLLRDETCWLLAADFDKEHWQEDVTAYLTACDAFGVPVALERSRSGNGGHVWVFFDAPVAATQARKFGCALLTRAMEHRHQIGLDSYDRLFPNQDTLPKGGFGNLIALPLQRTPRQMGNSGFLDRNFEPHPDQWAFLSSVRPMQPEEVDVIVAAATRSGSVVGVRPGYAGHEVDDDPWTMPPSGKRPETRVVGPFPPSVRVTIANLVYIMKEGLPPAMLNRLWRLAAFQNPEFYRAQAMRLSTFGKPRVISCAEDFERHIGLPRGCLGDVEELLATHAIGVDPVDERQWGARLDVAFQGKLAPSQRQAAEGILAHDIGVLCSPTAFGKTVVASWLIAARRVNTLVLVHRKHLLDQWRERLATFLDLPTGTIGQISGGRNRTGGQIDVALIQSLCRGGNVDDVVAEYGQVIVDECHHIPAFTFERVLRAAKARFVIGLTATPIRKDGHHPIVAMQCGPLRFHISPKEEAATRPFEQVVIPRPTSLRMPDVANTSGIHGVYAALATSEQRNDLICADLLDVLRQGRTPLLLTERKEHLTEFARRLEGHVRHVVVLHGGMGIKKRRAIAERLQSIPLDDSCAILATGRYAGEGFDHPRLDTLLLAVPISWSGTLRQYAGRIQREHPGKDEVRIYDYVDMGVPVLERMYEKRRKGYLAMGYRIQSDSIPTEEAKALPL